MATVELIQALTRKGPSILNAQIKTLSTRERDYKLFDRRERVLLGQLGPTTYQSLLIRQQQYLERGR